MMGASAWGFPSVLGLEDLLQGLWFLRPGFPVLNSPTVFIVIILNNNSGSPSDKIPDEPP